MSFISEYNDIRSTQDLLFQDGKSTYLMDFASAVSCPARALDNPVLQFQAARAILFAIAYFASFGAINLLANEYLRHCEIEAIANNTISVHVPSSILHWVDDPL